MIFSLTGSHVFNAENDDFKQSWQSWSVNCYTSSAIHSTFGSHLVIIIQARAAVGVPVVELEDEPDLRTVKIHLLAAMFNAQR